MQESGVTETRTPSGDTVQLAIPGITTRRELLFTTAPSSPPLALPPSMARGRGKYDYSQNTEKPFSFADIAVEPQEKLQVIVDPDDFLASIPEPEVGIFPVEFDQEKFQKVLANTSCPDYVPFVFTNPTSSLRAPDKIEDKEKLMDVKEITAPSKKKQVDPKQITFIKLVDITLDNKIKKNIGKAISQYTNLSILILRGLKLQKLDDFNLPNLQYCDLANNEIRTVKMCLAMFKRSPYLEIIKLMDNPVAKKPTYRKKLIGNCPLYLKAVDDTRIEIAERLEAINTFGPKAVKHNIGQLHWDLCFSACQDVKAMQTWNPSQLVMLALPKLDLELFNVGSLVNLEYLDLSRDRKSVV